jgi:hypothetical protein
MRYSGQIKTEAILQFGLHRVLCFLRRIWNKRPANEEEKYLQLLYDRIYRIKKITKDSIRALFMDYKENLKFQYLYKLVDAASGVLFEDMAGRIRAFTVDLTSIARKVEDTQEAKGISAERLGTIARQIRGEIEQLENIKRSTLEISGV